MFSSSILCSESFQDGILQGTLKTGFKINYLFLLDQVHGYCYDHDNDYFVASGYTKAL